MAYIQKNIPPANKSFSFSINDMSGGLNNRSFVIADNQASDIENMDFTDEVVMEKRPGQVLLTGDVMRGTITFMDEYAPYQEAPMTIRASNRRLYVNNIYLCDVAGKVNGTNYMGKYYFVDGAKIYAFGKFAQASSTFETVIGTPVTGYTLLEVVNPPSGFTPLAHPNKQGMRQIDYTNKKVWYEPCAYEMEDTSLGANVLPVSPKYIVSHKGRLFVSGSATDDDNVFITNVSNALYFAVTLPMQATPNADRVNGLIVYDDAVVIGRFHDLHAIDGMTNDPNLGFPLFQLRKINSHTGFANGDAARVAHNFLFFLGSDGNAYSLGSVRADVKITLTSIISQNIDLFAPPINLSILDIPTATSYFARDFWYISINDKVLVYSYRHRAWTMYTGLSARSFYLLDGELTWSGEEYPGYVVKFGSNFNDFGERPYEAHWVSKWHDMGNASSYKQFRECFLVAHTFDSFRSDIRLTFEIDYVDVNSNIIVNNQISVWGESKWGDRFITRNINASAPFVIGRRGRQIRFTFRNGFNVFTSVDRIEDLNAIIGRKEGIVVELTGEQQYFLFTGGNWVKLSSEDINQPMRVYQINGDYEFRGKR